MTPSKTNAEKFAEFHANSPDVYVVLCRLAREWIDRTGRHSLGIGALFERARWEIAIATSDPDFKLNNNYRAFYARKIMAQEPDLRGLFSLRKSEADSVPEVFSPDERSTYPWPQLIQIR